jgi:hypothetical protein
MNAVVYYLEDRTYIPTHDGEYLQEFKNVEGTKGGVHTGNKIQNPFSKIRSIKDIDMKDILFDYLCFFIPSIIILVSCLLYIYKSPDMSKSVLIMFYVFGIILSVIDIFMLILPTIMRNTIYSRILFFILGSLIFTCSVLIIYFSKINLDAEQDTRKTLIICVVFIGVFTIVNLAQVCLDKIEDPEPDEHPISKQIREKYTPSITRRISE